MDSPIKYRAYSTYRGTHILGIRNTIAETINLIEDRIYKEDATYLIVQQDDELNEDYPFAFIYSIEDFEKLKSMYEPKEKRLKK